MSSNETIIKFNDVSFEWQANKPILTEASFAIRKGAKLTLMGQNGAGKSTIFNLIMKDSTPDSGAINLADNITRNIPSPIPVGKPWKLTLNPKAANPRPNTK